MNRETRCPEGNGRAVGGLARLFPMAVTPCRRGVIAGRWPGISSITGLGRKRPSNRRSSPRGAALREYEQRLAIAPDHPEVRRALAQRGQPSGGGLSPADIGPDTCCALRLVQVVRRSMTSVASPAIQAASS